MAWNGEPCLVPSITSERETTTGDWAACPCPPLGLPKGSKRTSAKERTLDFGVGYSLSRSKEIGGDGYSSTAFCCSYC